VTGRRTSPWSLAAAGWTAVIYATIPVFRALREWFTDRWDQSLIGWAVIGAVAAVTAAALVHGFRRARRPSAANAAWLLAVAGIAIWWTSRLWEHPEEAVHLLSYGVLGVLLVRALEECLPDAGSLLAAIALGSLVGTIDEIIQWITPGRFWDLRDVAINGGGCALAVVAVWRLEESWRPPGRRSLRLTVRLAAAELLLLTLCLANTPQRVVLYSGRVPLLGHLAHADNSMAEYGHRHVSPGVGEFSSRFTLDELAHIDRERGAEAAAIVERYPEDRYARFLADYPAGRDPFVHEARVHLFSRDRHLSLRASHPPGSWQRRHHATVALRENQILEHFFGRTLELSGNRLPKDLLEDLRRELLPQLRVTSKAGSHLITWITEGALRTLLVIAAGALLALDFSLGCAGRSPTGRDRSRGRTGRGTPVRAPDR
jgi:hypothetical protein